MSRQREQAGFTILELMIATVVFSVILLLVTYGIIQIGNRYYKATLQSQTQAAARNAIDEISRNIQFSNGSVGSAAVTNGIGAYCVNNVQYAFVLGKMQDGDGQKHVLVARPDPGHGCEAPAAEYFQGNLADNERDLLGNRMRVVAFDVTGPSTNGTVGIKLRIVAGDNDLLCSPSLNDCGSTGTTDLSKPDLQCRSGSGSTYCAYSELSTAVTPRVSH